MWAMYGPEWKISDSAYLAEISKTSRDLAESVMSRELERVTEARLWLFDLIETVAWGWTIHGQQCSCPLEDLEDPVVRVRASAMAARALIEATGKDLLDFARECGEAGAGKFGRQIIASPELAKAVEAALIERHEELAERHESRRKRLSRS